MTSGTPIKMPWYVRWLMTPSMRLRWVNRQRMG
jgi:hypothetical protein